MIGKDDFAALVAAKSGMLYRVASTILRSDEDCKDALQEAVFRAWENRRSLRDETLFQTWITRIVINESHTLLRRKRKYLLQSTVYRQTDTRIPDPGLRYMIDQLPEKNLPAVGAALLGRIYLPANRRDAPCYAGHGAKQAEPCPETAADGARRRKGGMAA